MVSQFSYHLCVQFLVFPTLKDLEWLLFSWLENHYDEELHAGQKRLETAYQTRVYMSECVLHY